MLLVAPFSNMVNHSDFDTVELIHFLGFNCIFGDQMLLKVFKIVIPNFQLFSFSEGIVTGAALAPGVLWQMTWLTAGYLVVFVFISLIAFVDKEF